jgi:cation diffusion facilitator family transporter
VRSTPGSGRVTRFVGRLRHALVPHSHDWTHRTDPALQSSRRGLRALTVSFAVLLVTAALQAVVAALSGSVALFGDTVHNAGDALTALPLAIAFILGRRAASRRFTYGLGRVEDLAALIVLMVIAASAVVAGYQSVHRLWQPAIVHQPLLVALAGLLGVVGNEVVAHYRIRVGRAIGSAALVADGLHARTDALASVAVIIAAAGTWLRIPFIDPAAGLLITAVICLVFWQAAGQVLARLLDGVNPHMLDTAERTLATVPGVQGVNGVRLRWVGHRLHAEALLVADAELSLSQAHELAVEAEHRLRHALRGLRSATLHVDPVPMPGQDHHAVLAHHEGHCL